MAADQAGTETPGTAIVTCTGLVKIYRAAGVEVFALQGLDLTVAAGEFLAIVGPSGSGKSTLMSVLGGLDTPSAGEARVAGWELHRLTPRQRDRYRREVTGFLWQNSALNLLPYLSALDNVLLALDLAGDQRPGGRRRAGQPGRPHTHPVPPTDRARHLLELLGLAGRQHARPTELSGGEQQRVALAVALGHRPSVLLCDEPTGALDEASRDQVLVALRQVNQELGTTVLVVTHDMAVAEAADRILHIRDGKVSTERRTGTDEVVVLDSAGRMQIPTPILRAAGIAGRAQVELRGCEVVVRAPGTRARPPADSPAHPPADSPTSRKPRPSAGP